MNLKNDVQILQGMEFLEYFAARMIQKASSISDIEFNTGEPVRYIGFEFPELHNREGIIINARLVQGLMVINFPGLGEWHIRPENLMKSDA